MTTEEKLQKLETQVLDVRLAMSLNIDTLQSAVSEINRLRARLDKMEGGAGYYSPNVAPNAAQAPRAGDAEAHGRASGPRRQILESVLRMLGIDASSIIDVGDVKFTTTDQRSATICTTANRELAAAALRQRHPGHWISLGDSRPCKGSPGFVHFDFERTDTDPPAPEVPKA